MVIVVLVSNSTLVSAENTEGPKPILDVIRDQGDYLPTDNVYNREMYDKTMEGYDLSEEFMIKIYLDDVYSYADKDIEVQKEKARQRLGILHVAFQENKKIDNYIHHIILLLICMYILFTNLF